MAGLLCDGWWIVCRETESHSETSLRAADARRLAGQVCKFLTPFSTPTVYLLTTQLIIDYLVERILKASSSVNCVS